MPPHAQKQGQAANPETKPRTRTQQWKFAPQVFELKVSSRRLDRVNLVFFHIDCFVCFVLPAAFMLWANFANKSDKLLIKPQPVLPAVLRTAFARKILGKFRRQATSRTKLLEKTQPASPAVLRAETGRHVLAARRIADKLPGLPAVAQSFARHAFGRFRNQLASRTKCSNKVESGTKKPRVRERVAQCSHLITQIRVIAIYCPKEVDRFPVFFHRTFPNEMKTLATAIGAPTLKPGTLVLHNI